MTLRAEKVLISGGAGYVGSMLVRSLLRRGARVAAQSRSAARLSELTDTVRSLGPDAADRFVAISGSFSSDPDARDLTDRLLAGFGPPTAVVAGLGGWLAGPELAELPLEEWRDTLEAGLTSHFASAKALGPMLAPGSAYIFLNGIAALEPRAGSGAVCVAGAGQDMLVRVLRAEALGQRVRFCQLTILGDVVEDTPMTDSPVFAEQVCDVIERWVVDRDSDNLDQTLLPAAAAAARELQ